MKKSLRYAWALGLLGVMILWGIYTYITTWKALSEANPQFSGAVAAAGTALIVAVVTVVGGKWLERQATIAKELRDKKCPVYEDLLKFMFKIFSGIQQKQPVTPDENGFVSF